MFSTLRRGAHRLGPRVAASRIPSHSRQASTLSRHPSLASSPFSKRSSLSQDAVSFPFLPPVCQVAARAMSTLEPMITVQQFGRGSMGSDIAKDFLRYGINSVDVNYRDSNFVKTTFKSSDEKTGIFFGCKPAQLGQYAKPLKKFKGHLLLIQAGWTIEKARELAPKASSITLGMPIKTTAGNIAMVYTQAYLSDSVAVDNPSPFEALKKIDGAIYVDSSEKVQSTLCAASGNAYLTQCMSLALKEGYSKGDIEQSLKACIDNEHASTTEMTILMPYFKGMSDVIGDFFIQNGFSEEEKKSLIDTLLKDQLYAITHETELRDKMKGVISPLGTTLEMFLNMGGDDALYFGRDNFMSSELNISSEQLEYLEKITAEKSCVTEAALKEALGKSSSQEERDTGLSTLKTSFKKALEQAMLRANQMVATDDDPPVQTIISDVLNYDTLQRVSTHMI